MSNSFNPTNVNLNDADPAAVICYLNSSENEYDGRLGARISALFVILIVSTAATLFPVLASRIDRLKIPIHVYLFARYFGAGVIIATAFIHLLDPAYSEIGPNTCVGMTGSWASYSWPPAIVLVSIMMVFLMDLSAARYVEHKFGLSHGENIENQITDQASANAHNLQMCQPHLNDTEAGKRAPVVKVMDEGSSDASSLIERSFQQQIAAFLILEFGVIFHSVIIGLNLGSVGSEFKVLYPVIVFHQSFEGLGIGARMSAIPFPRHYRWLPWTLCAAYGLTTPIAIAIGLGLRTTYNAGSFTANVVSGVLDAISAGILIYTGLVELLAKDFLHNPEQNISSKRLVFMVTCVLLGAGIMALLGKWA